MPQPEPIIISSNPVGRIVGNDIVIYANRLTIEEPFWGVQTWMLEEQEVLSAIARGDVAHSGTLSVTMSPQSILKLDAGLIERAARVQSLCLVVSSEPVPLEYLAEIGATLDDWRQRFGILIAVQMFHEATYSMDRFAILNPDFVRVSVEMFSFLDIDETRYQKSREVAMKLVSISMMTLGMNAVRVIATGVSTETQLKHCRTMGAEYVEGPLLNEKFGVRRYRVTPENSVLLSVMQRAQGSP